jgi:hypothetical protein
VNIATDNAIPASDFTVINQVVKYFSAQLKVTFALGQLEFKLTPRIDILAIGACPYVLRPPFSCQ